jgi:hypothetical protein
LKNKAGLKPKLFSEELIQNSRNNKQQTINNKHQTNNGLGAFKRNKTIPQKCLEKNKKHMHLFN